MSIEADPAAEGGARLIVGAVPGTARIRGGLSVGIKRVVLAKPRGFCAGVVRAIEIVERALDLLPPPIYVFHEIVHNRYVV